MNDLHPAPRALDALYALLRAVGGEGGVLAGARVDDGPPPDEFDEFDAIGIGVQIDEFEALTSVIDYAERSESDAVDVQCIAQSWTGDSDPQVWSRLRGRVFALLDVVRAEFVTYPDLGLPEVVWSARITRWSMRQVATGRGAPMVVLPFTVRINTYRVQ